MGFSDSQWFTSVQLRLDARAVKIHCVFHTFSMPTDAQPHRSYLPRSTSSPLFPFLNWNQWSIFSRDYQCFIFHRLYFSEEPWDKIIISTELVYSHWLWTDVRVELRGKKFSRLLISLFSEDVETTSKRVILYIELLRFIDTIPVILKNILQIYSRSVRKEAIRDSSDVLVRVTITFLFLSWTELVLIGLVSWNLYTWWRCRWITEVLSAPMTPRNHDKFPRDLLDTRVYQKRFTCV